MLADPRMLRLASTAGLLAVVVAWVLVAGTGETGGASLVVLGLGALCAGHVLMHALRAVPAAVLTALLGAGCVAAAVSGRFTGSTAGAWLGMLVLSSWILWTCVGPRGADDRRRAPQRG